MEFQFKKADKTSMRQHNEETKSDTSALGASAADEDILARLLRLEKIACIQDDQIRFRESHITEVFIMNASDPLGKLLLNKGEEYQAARPPRGPHPWGPPRHLIIHSLINWMLQNLEIGESEFRTLHAKMNDMKLLDPKSASYCTVKKIKDGRTLLKLRPLPQATTIWADPLDMLEKHVRLLENAERKNDTAPAGPLIREVKKSANRK
eukprot:TRINITY_DN41096_c0_g1_i1.p2 TRINITY_DN41096_c0_g1~~TRINITY_DN41096_c0_g1_i1.p2  ORF type:complete len:208 (+),score=46.82 TRINITY_DN41096_c0_g1_i1:57-680(+)